MASEQRLMMAMVESLEKFNARLLTLGQNSENDYNLIMNKIMHNLETIELIKNNEVKGIVYNGDAI